MKKERGQTIGRCEWFVSFHVQVKMADTMQIVVTTSITTGSNGQQFQWVQLQTAVTCDEARGRS